MDLTAVVASGSGLLLLYVVLRLMVVPLRMMARLAYNAAIGLAMLLAFNVVGTYFNQQLPVNLVTVLAGGLLGVPGLGLVVALTRLW
ncbi:MAG: pro-sigmaK processing inhibitor BofA family protein [Actinobacteria bacterium]|nr:pro-sigmaK processing inhibitor BofA family protein [Actinomycetota bacterium]